MEETELRSRARAPIRKAEGSLEAVRSPKKSVSFWSERLGYRHWLFAAAAITATVALVNHLDYRLPPPKPADDFGNFSEVRARKWLEELTSHGPRPSGSHNTEVKARKLLLHHIQQIQRTASPRVAIELEEQRPSGCYDLSFFQDFTLCYRDILNVVVRIGPSGRSPTKHSFLVSCHFDSVPDSPGATDDGVSCAIMMDVLRVMSRQEKELEHDVIFLFNGAEENFLQAAHGFISTHKWRHSIRAFMNLEGAGAGGRELLFQAGPGHAWLVKAYVENAPFPHCSVVAQEVFQAGLIPSDTDFRIYRDFGRVPGLDIAYTRNGYVYHTEFDQVRFIQSGAIQRAGENVLGVTRAILRSPYFTNPGTYHEGRWVFFDVVGLFNLCYHLDTGVILNYAVCVLIILKIIFRIRAHHPVNSKADGGYSTVDLGKAVGIHVGVGAVMVLLNLGMSRVVTLSGLSLVWYARPITLIPLYFVPTMIVGLLLHSAIARRFFRKRDGWLMEALFTDATLGIFSFILFIMTYRGLASAFLILAHVLFPLTRPLLALVFPPKSAWGHTIGSLICLFPVTFMGAYALYIFNWVFIPLMGRSGTGLDPEYLMAFMTAIGPVSVNLYLGGWVHVSRRVVRLLGAVLWLCLIAFAVLLFTGYGEPYLWSKDGPRLRRITILHVNRRMFARDGALEKAESGLWMSSFDNRGSEDLPQVIRASDWEWMDGEVGKAAIEVAFLTGSHPPNCSAARDDFCDLPYYIPVRRMLQAERSRWMTVQAKAPVLLPLSIELLSRTQEADGRINMTFSLAGPDHVTMSVTPEPGVELDRWSFTDSPFRYKARSYFAFLAYALPDTPPWTFSLLFRTWEGWSGEALSVMSVAGHQIHGQTGKSQTLRTLEQNIRDKRILENDTKGWFRWRMTPSTWTVQYISKYF